MNINYNYSVSIERYNYFINYNVTIKAKIITCVVCYKK